MQNATQRDLPTQTSGEETDESGASNERKYQHEAQASGFDTSTKRKRVISASESGDRLAWDHAISEITRLRTTRLRVVLVWGVHL
ncbi:hypothetical protein [Rosistilla oblonga]|uniref:hypothetical protein n=1 Tax=Rosistilla oblonga TaxID=2527990 RepID=UPI003A97C775